MADPTFREQYIVRQWLIPVANTPEAFAAYMKTDSARWRRLIDVSGVTVE